MEQTVEIKRYGCRVDVGDDVDDGTLALIQCISVDGWRSMIRRDGYRACADPDVRVITRVIAEWVEMDDGEWVKLPDRQMTIVGPVVPLETPDFDYDPLRITLPR